jgi:hypothetical protein
MLHRLEGLEAIVRDLDLMAAQGEERGQRGCRVNVVVHDQHAPVWLAFRAQSFAIR